jgi:hypothetical protein
MHFNISSLFSNILLFSFYLAFYFFSTFFDIFRVLNSFCLKLCDTYNGIDVKQYFITKNVDNYRFLFIFYFPSIFFNSYFILFIHLDRIFLSYTHFLSLTFFLFVFFSHLFDFVFSFSLRKNPISLQLNHLRK